MNPVFAAAILAFLLAWALGSYFFLRISRGTKLEAARKSVQPVLRLADQWIAEVQSRMEDLVQRSEQPLSAAQNELLELRLEAGRLPQGVKDLKLVRESLSSANPLSPAQSLAEVAGFYLPQGDFTVVDPALVRLKTPLGEMPLTVMERGAGPLDDARMRDFLSRASLALSKAGTDLVAGGFVYFRDGGDYEACQANPEWMAGLKSRGLMAMDAKGLSALLTALRLVGDGKGVLEAFGQGVESTRGLAGQSERMNGALSRLGSDALRVRTVLEGSQASGLKDRG